MATQKIVLKTDTFENQRVKINEIGQDTYNILTGGVTIENLSVDGYITESTDGGTTYWNVVTQQDVGTAANQVPLNQYLGQLAFLDDFSPNGLRREGGSSDDVVVNASGNVGIGTTPASSTVSLHIGKENTRGILLNNSSIGTSVTDGTYITNSNDGSFGIFNQENSFMRFGTNNTERLRIDSSGNVGIGTSSPSEKLEIGNSAAGIDNNGTNGQLERIGSFKFGTTSSFGNRGPTASIDHVIRTDNWANQQFSSQIAFSTAENTGGTLTQRAVITNQGYFGVGTTTPSAGIHVNAPASQSPAIFEINTSEAARIDSAGRLLVGTSSTRLFGSTGYIPQILLEGTAGSSSTVGIVRNSANASGCSLSLGKSRATSVGGVAAVSDNDELVLIDFQGADGTGLIPAARIQAFVDGTPGANDMPGRLVFSTTSDGASIPTERLRIDSSGNVGIGTSSPSCILDVQGGAGSTIKNLNAQWVGSGTNSTFRTDGVFDFQNTSGTNRLRIDSSGNVGIGVTAAAEKLHVAGDVRIEDNSPRLGFYDANASGIGDATGGIEIFNSSGSRSCFLGATEFANVLSFGTNNSERMRIDSSGNVGIGVVPSYRLHTSIYGSNYLYLDNTRGPASAYIGVLDTETQFVVGGAHPLTFGTNSTERMRITSDGRVGIGTSTPTNAKLEVSNSTNGEEGIRINDSRATPSVNRRTLDIRYTGANGRTANNTQLLYLYDNNASSTKPLMEVENASSSLFVIDSSGNVGIGTSSPGSYSSTANNLVVQDTAGQGGLTLVSTTTGASNIFFADTAGTAQGQIKYQHSGDYMRFYTDASERLRIDSSGNVGIGTSSPTQKLTVASSDTSVTRIQIANSSTGVGATDGLQFSVDGNGYAGINNRENTDLYVSTNNTIRLTVKNNGNVGVGTSTPKSTLDTNGKVYLRNANYLAWHNGFTSESAYLYADGSGTLTFGTAGSERLRITSAGNVGIGTSSPSRTLDVTGTARISSVLTMGSYIQGTTQLDLYGDPSSSSGLRLDSSGNVGIGTSSPTGFIHIQGSSTGTETYGRFTTGAASGDQSLVIKSGSSRDHMAIQVATNAGANDDLALQPDGGNVGIGTTTPTQILDVVGNIKTSGSLYGPANFIIDPAAVGDNTGVVRIKGDLYVDGTTTQINSETLTIADFVVGIASTATTDSLADGAGINIGPDNTFKYDHTNTSLKSSENLNVASGKTYKVNGTDVLSATTLGSGVVNSSLTSVGTLTGLTLSGDIYLNSTDKKIFLSNDYDQYITANAASNYLAFAAANQERLRITSTGEVKANGSFLESTDGGTTYWNVVTQQDVGTAANQVPLNQYLGQLAFLDDFSPNGLRRSGGSSDDVVVNASGNIGIGTNNPSYKLQVENSGTTLGRFLRTNAGAGLFQIMSQDGGSITLGLGDVSDPDIQYIKSDNSDNSLSFGTDADERLRITSAGNVGIGNTSPAEKLEISGRLRIFDGGYPYIDIGISTSNYFRLIHDNPGDRFYIGKNSNASLVITGGNNVEPGADATQDLGSATKRWANIYSADLQLSNEGAANEVDGTWGQYTIQEGEEDLFLINRRSGKKYKFNLTEV